MTAASIAKELREAAKQVAENIAKPGPWECSDIEYQGRFSNTAVYAAGNAHPWRMVEAQGPSDKAEKAIAELIANASPDRIATLIEAFEAMGEALKFYRDNWQSNAEGDFSTPGLSRSWMEPNDGLFSDEGRKASDALAKAGL